MGARSSSLTTTQIRGPRWAFLSERARDARLVSTPIILISGQADAHKTASELGLAGCIEKPIAIANLIRAIQRVIRSPAGLDTNTPESAPRYKMQPASTTATTPSLDKKVRAD